MAVYRRSYLDKKTGEKKESKVWWYEFVYGGARIRASAETTRKTVAIEAEKDHHLRLEKARAGMPAEAGPRDRIRSVKDRLTEYERKFSVNHKTRAIRWVKDRSKYLHRHLGNALVADLTEERVIVDYIVARQNEDAGNRTINMEIGILSRALGHTWRALWPKLKKLDESTDVGRALTRDEVDRLLEAAAKNKSPFIRLFILVALQTGMRADEIRVLRWKQIDWERHELVVGESKTKAGRKRPIPLHPELQNTLEMYVTWYSGTLGQAAGDWFLFPHCKGQMPDDPTVPIGGVKSAWYSVCEAAGVLCRLRRWICPATRSRASTNCAGMWKRT
jgi:integrase